MTTNYREDPVSSPEDGSGDSVDAKERAQQVAGSAAEQGQHVAGVAQEHAKKITGEAKDQARGLIDEASSQIDEQSRIQKTKLAETLRGFGEDLERMSGQDSDGSEESANEGGDMARQLVQQAAHQAQDLAGHLENREPQELLDDVRRFARQKPGTFILGALVAGVVVGRLTRGAKAANDEDESTVSNARPPSESPVSARAVEASTATPVPGGLDPMSLPGTNVSDGAASGAPR
jgi:uncharacterized protein YjbJ (UPF0337 family)